MSDFPSRLFCGALCGVLAFASGGCQSSSPSADSLSSADPMSDLSQAVKEKDFSATDQALAQIAAKTAENLDNRIQLQTIRQFEDADQSVEQDLIAFTDGDSYYEASIYRMLDGSIGSINCEKVEERQEFCLNLGMEEDQPIVFSAFSQTPKREGKPESLVQQTLLGQMVGGSHTWFTELEKLLVFSVDANSEENQNSQANDASQKTDSQKTESQAEEASLSSSGKAGSISSREADESSPDANEVLVRIRAENAQTYNDAMRALSQPKGSLGYFDGTTQILLSLKNGVVQTIEYRPLDPEIPGPVRSIEVRQASSQETDWIKEAYAGFDQLKEGSKLPSFPDPFSR